MGLEHQNPCRDRIVDSKMRYQRGGVGVHGYRLVDLSAAWRIDIGRYAMTRANGSPVHCKAWLTGDTHFAVSYTLGF